MNQARFEDRQRSIYTSPDLTRTSDGGYLCPQTQRAWTAWCDALSAPIDMLLYCPNCGVQHIDKDNSDELRIQAAELGIDREGDRECERWIEEREWTNPPHRSHLCASCGCIWRPADVPTNGVEVIKTVGQSDSWPVPHNEEVVAAVACRKCGLGPPPEGFGCAWCDKPLTAATLADALDHFWNAAIGASHNEHPTVSCIAQGIDAVARELRK